MFYLKVKNVFHLCKYSCRKRSVLGSTVDKANKFTPQKGIHKRFKEKQENQLLRVCRSPCPGKRSFEKFSTQEKGHEKERIQIQRC